MTLRNLFLVAAVVTLIFGLGLTFVPGITYAPYKMPLDDAGVYTARFVGAAYLGFSAIAWLAKDADPSQARRAIIVGFLVMEVVSCLVSLSGVLFGPASWPSLSTVLITLVLALGFAYFFLKEPHST